MMALYFKERMDEQKEDPLKNKIRFTHQWITTPPQPSENGRESFRQKMFRTSYQFASEIWSIQLSANGIRIDANGANDEDDADDVPSQAWNGCCYLSYNLYYDENMRFLYYSSTRIQMNSFPHTDAYQTSDGFMAKMNEGVATGKVRKMVIFVELQLPTKNFYRPFYMPSCDLYKTLCHHYPADMENNFRFAYAKNGDYTIKCPNGSIPCRRIVLNISSEYMKKHFKTSKDSELVVEHSADVVKPVVTYLHSRCFEMPQLYDLDFAKRLLTAIDFFKPEHEDAIRNAVQLSLCQKFADETHDFNSILRWTSLASRLSLYDLEKMISTVIVKKYYYKWQDTFPLAARNFENQLFLDTFGTENAEIFEKIDRIFEKSFFTNVILE